MRPRLLAGAALIVAAAVLPAAAQLFRPQDADSLERKLEQIARAGAQLESAETTRAALRTSIAEREINAYFRFQGAAHLPTGVREPIITIDANGRVTARVIVDLDVVRNAQPRSLADPLLWVRGKLEVRAAGTVSASGGQGRVSVESAMLDGKPIPKSVLQDLIVYYTRTPEDPAGFNLDQPFVLPQGIRSAEFFRGLVVLVQ